MPHVDLLGLPFFQGITLDSLVALVDRMRPVQFESGQTIMTEGKEGPTTLLIATYGKVGVSKRSPDGTDRPLAELKAPTLCGEVELFCQIPPVCSVTAKSVVTAFALDRPTFEQMIDSQDPAVTRFAVNVARVACHRLAVSDVMLSQVLGQRDLVSLRRKVFAEMRGGEDVPHTTGVFERPKF